MRIKTFFTKSYSGSAVHLHLIDVEGNSAYADIAPLPGFSQETLEEALGQLEQKKDEVLDTSWELSTYQNNLEQLDLLPSVLFGLESALLSLLDPLPAHAIAVSAFLRGSPDEILKEAHAREKEGYTSAKLKVSKLTFKEARHLIHTLKDIFSLRIDVNRAWGTDESLHFFSEFTQDAFDYVEEPFQNPKDLKLFTHPLAVDESYPRDLSLKELEDLPTLKAVIYKPTIQGGLLKARALHQWTSKRGIDFVLGSSFESDIGLAHIARMAIRLSLPAPIGIGTYHLLNDYFLNPPLQFSKNKILIPN